MSVLKAFDKLLKKNNLAVKLIIWFLYFKYQ